MKCQRCDDRAVIRIVDVDENKRVHEVSLCFKHAADHLQSDVPIVEPEKPVPAGPSGAQCPHCQITFGEFRGSGRLGCPHDYGVFGRELRPLLENVHGSLKHVGKAPRQGTPDAAAPGKAMRLRQEIQKAVTVENYELAARLRDQLDALERKR